MTAATSPRILAISLWVLAIGCFAGSWATGDRRVGGVGAALVVLYIIFAAKARRPASGHTS